MKQKLFITTALLIGILFVLNLLSNEFHLRLDLTSEKQYTLSEATLDILKNLEDPVTIRAYFSKDLPPNIIKTRQDFQEMLIEYSNRADGLIQYEFINPNEKESTEQEAVQNGIQPVMINIREKDQMKQQKAFLGATLSLGTNREVIPFLQPGAAMEYALTTAIKKISITEKPTIGFIQGHGEPPLTELSQVDDQLRVLYNTEEIRLDTTLISDKIKTLVLIRPSDSIPAGQLQKLDGFLSRGGRMVIAINRVTGNLQDSYGSAVSTGLETWLQQKGILVDDNFVVDAKCGSVNVVQQQGAFQFQTQISFPYLPQVGKFADHPISKGLESVLFEFASTVSYIGDTTKKFIPLAMTSEKSSALKAPQYFNIQKQWTEADLPQRNLIMAAAIEGKLSGSTNSKMVVIADGDFAVSGPQRGQPQRRPNDNISLLTNSVDWLSDDTGLISLRTKGVTSRPIDQLEDSTKSILKYSNFLLPILLAIGYGLVRIQQNRIRRFKRMSENYEEA
jgi:gliding-associated putative ABC transporter substrate-binding component GldG